MKTIPASAVDHKNNNLDIVRFIAACMVLYGHSFVFLGLPEPLFLSWCKIGPLGVFVFFIISGYLITQSWDRDKNLIRFFIRRGLRIFPGLFVCLVASVYILGPIFTTWTLKNYFTSKFLIVYLRDIMLYISFYLPGVFETNRVPNAVNGSLWSLPAEFFLYCCVAAIGFLLTATSSKFEKYSKYIILFIGLAFMFMTYHWAINAQKMVVIYGTDMRQLFICGTYFWLGAICYKFNLQRFFSVSAVAVAFSILCILERWPAYEGIGAWFMLPVIVLGFGFSYSPVLNKHFFKHDYSYGMYIYAFPVQQSMAYLWPNMNISLYLLICFGITLILACLSWHFVEMPMLKLKPAKNVNGITYLRNLFSDKIASIFKI